VRTPVTDAFVPPNRAVTIRFVPDDEHGNDESPLDDLFVAGARYQEPSAQEREKQAKEFQRQGREAARRNRRRKYASQSRKFEPWAFLGVVVLVVWLLMTKL
jgi:hypothetical protein